VGYPNRSNSSRRSVKSRRRKKRAGTSPCSCPRYERDSFSHAQRLPERFALHHAKLGLDERHRPVIVIDDKPGCAPIAVDPQRPHVTVRELDDSDVRFHDTSLWRRKSFHSSAAVSNDSLPCSRRSASALYQSTSFDTFLSTAAVEDRQPRRRCRLGGADRAPWPPKARRSAPNTARAPHRPRAAGRRVLFTTQMLRGMAVPRKILCHGSHSVLRVFVQRMMGAA
jgi:hypothetical protein